MSRRPGPKAHSCLRAEVVLENEICERIEDWSPLIHLDAPQDMRTMTHDYTRTGIDYRVRGLDYEFGWRPKRSFGSAAS